MVRQVLALKYNFIQRKHDKIKLIRHDKARVNNNNEKRTGVGLVQMYTSLKRLACYKTGGGFVLKVDGSC